MPRHLKARGAKQVPISPNITQCLLSWSSNGAFNAQLLLLKSSSHHQTIKSPSEIYESFHYLICCSKVNGKNNFTLSLEVDWKFFSFASMQLILFIYCLKNNRNIQGSRWTSIQTWFIYFRIYFETQSLYMIFTFIFQKPVYLLDKKIHTSHYYIL